MIADLVEEAILSHPRQPAAAAYFLYPALPMGPLSSPAAAISLFFLLQAGIRPVVSPETLPIYLASLLLTWGLQQLPGTPLHSLLKLPRAGSSSSSELAPGEAITRSFNGKFYFRRFHWPIKGSSRLYKNIKNVLKESNILNLSINSMFFLYKSAQLFSWKQKLKREDRCLVRWARQY